MNKSAFIEMIHQPSKLGKNELTALKKAEADFPYFQAIQVLLARSLSNLNHYDFDKQLHKTSLNVPDREILYRYIHDQPASLGVEVPSPNIEIESVSETHSSPITVDPIALEVMAPIVIEEKKEEAPITTEEVVVSIESKSIDLDDARSSLNKVDDSTPAIAAEAIPQALIEEVKPTLKLHEGEVHSFIEWLKLSKDGVPLKVEATIEAPAEEEIIKAKVVEPAKEIAQVSEAKIITEKPEDSSSNVVVFESILDKFIKESPRISRPKATFYSPANMAKQSVAEDEDLVTETLANLYHKQGHYKKAIRAYEKLCLIYPHKMAYFADLIQQIKLESKD